MWKKWSHRKKNKYWWELVIFRNAVPYLGNVSFDTNSRHKQILEDQIETTFLVSSFAMVRVFSIPTSYESKTPFTEELKASSGYRTYAMRRQIFRNHILHYYDTILSFVYKWICVKPLSKVCIMYNIIIYVWKNLFKNTNERPGGNTL